MSSGDTWDEVPVVYGRGSLLAYLKGLGIAVGGAAVAPNDAADLSFLARGIYVGGAGDVRVTMVNGDVVTFVAVPAGARLVGAIKRVWATGTTATNLVGLR